MAKRKNWKIYMYKGQVDFGMWHSNRKLEELGGGHHWWENLDDAKKQKLFNEGWVEKDPDYAFYGNLRFEYMNASSASGRQFVFTDIDTGLSYQMLPDSFTRAIKQAVKGVVTGQFGFEKVGSSIGIYLI